MEPEHDEMVTLRRSEVAAAEAQLESLRIRAEQAEQTAQAVLSRPTTDLRPAKPSLFSAHKGSSRITSWLAELGRYFKAANCHEPHKRISFAATLLRGAPATWYDRHDRDVRARKKLDFTSWEEFESAIIKQFQSVNHDRIVRDQLATLSQRTSVQAYVTRFTELCLEIEDISDAEMLDRFIRGLKPNAQRELELHRPVNLEDAIERAERVDAVDYRQRQRMNRDNFAPRRLPYNGPTPMELGAITHPHAELGAITAPNRQAALTTTEKARLRQEGKCFYCREPGHVALQCPKKGRAINASGQHHRYQIPARRQGNGRTR